jgi:hypothetical protein
VYLQSEVSFVLEQRGARVGYSSGAIIALWPAFAYYVSGNFAFLGLGFFLAFVSAASALIGLVDRRFWFALGCVVGGVTAFLLPSVETLRIRVTAQSRAEEYRLAGERLMALAAVECPSPPTLSQRCELTRDLKSTERRLAAHVYASRREDAPLVQFQLRDGARFSVVYRPGSGRGTGSIAQDVWLFWI